MRLSLLFLVGLLSIPSIAQHVFNVLRQEVRIPMRDGISLGAIVYRPDTDSRHPALVYRTPYGIADYDSYAELPVKAVKRGYVVYLVDVRGRYSSEGNFEAYRNEKEDGYDVIEWVARQPYCDGNVGTYGGSYPGIVQWQAISQSPPSLKAAAPEMTPLGSHHFFYYGGAFSLPWYDWFMVNILPDKRKRANDVSGTWSDMEAEQQWNAIKSEWYKYRPLQDFPLLKKYAPEYYDWLNHPDSSKWWSFVEVQNDFKKLQAPVFLLSGWYDAAYGPEGASRALEKIQKECESEFVRENSKLILGPWNHTTVTSRKTKFGAIDFGTSAGFDYDNFLLDWYDQVLKKNDKLILPKVSAFVMGDNFWHTFNNWPPEESKSTSFYLHSTGKTGTSNADGELNSSLPYKESPDRYVFDPKDPLWDKSYEKSFPYDQREHEARKDVLVYTSAPLQEELWIAGEVSVELFVSSSATDTDFSFTLCDVYPDGTSINLAGLDAGYLRMRYRMGFEKQVFMKPGNIYKIKIAGLHTANLFKQGHRIRLLVTSSKAPHYDPNPNTGAPIAAEVKLISAEQTIYHDKAHPSRLILPVITKIEQD